MQLGRSGRARLSEGTYVPESPELGLADTGIRLAYPRASPKQVAAAWSLPKITDCDAESLCVPCSLCALSPGDEHQTESDASQSYESGNR